jgi:ABC-type dipeptide/oligopeptide/nickel transport system permease component
VAVYFTVAVIVVNLLVDLTYSWLDPRVRVS